MPPDPPPPLDLTRDAPPPPDLRAALRRLACGLMRAAWSPDPLAAAGLVLRDLAGLLAGMSGGAAEGGRPG